MSCYLNMVIWMGFYKQSCSQLCRQGANWEPPSGLDLRFQIFLGHSALSAYVFPSTSPKAKLRWTPWWWWFGGIRASGEPLKEGNNVLSHIISYYIICCIMLCCIMLYCIILYYIVLYSIILYYYYHYYYDYYCIIICCIIWY